MGTRLRGRVAVVTGASSGIGAATVRTLLQEGVHVVACARRADRLSQLSENLPADGDRLFTMTCDVRYEAEAEELIRRTLDWGGRLDILINNAGLSRGSHLETSNPAELRLMLDTNVFALANLARLATPALRLARGDIVNISSTATKSMIAGSALYSATKAAVAALSEALRKEVSPDGVRVITLYPGFVDTEFFSCFDEQKRKSLDQLRSSIEVLKPTEIADVIAFALACPPHVSLNEIVVRPTKQIL